VAQDMTITHVKVKILPEGWLYEDSWCIWVMSRLFFSSLVLMTWQRWKPVAGK